MQVEMPHRWRRPTAISASTARWRTFVGAKRLFATDPLFFN
jgi:hypothetical protein